MLRTITYLYPHAGSPYLGVRRDSAARLCPGRLAGSPCPQVESRIPHTLYQLPRRRPGDPAGYVNGGGDHEPARLVPRPLILCFGLRDVDVGGTSYWVAGFRVRTGETGEPSRLETRGRVPTDTLISIIGMEVRDKYRFRATVVGASLCLEFHCPNRLCLNLYVLSDLPFCLLGTHGTAF